MKKSLIFGGIVGSLIVLSIFSSTFAQQAKKPVQQVAQQNTQQQQNDEEKIKKAVVVSPMTFSEAMLVTVAFGSNDLTDAQSAKLQTFFGNNDDTETHVSLLKNIVYKKALRDGAIPPQTELGAVNWQGLLTFLQGLLPIIEAIIKMFGG